MAYSTGSYTGIDDALDKFAAWAVTNGWMQNNLSADGTGKRLHIQKTIGAGTFYFNLRSATAESITGAGTITGICVNGSTAWDGTGTAWNLQTGYTTRDYLGAITACGNIADVDMHVNSANMRG